jgi:hypothetical protein
MRKNLGFIFRNTIGQVIGTVSALIFTVLAARLLTISDYGELRYVLALLPLAMTITLPGFDSIILRFSGLGVRVPLVRILIVRILAGCIGSVIILFALIVYSGHISNTLFFLLIVTLLALPFFETATGYRNYLLGQGLTRLGNSLLLQARLGALFLFILFVILINCLDINSLWIYPAWMASVIFSTLSSSLRVLLKLRKNNFQWRRFNGRMPVREAFASTLAGLIYTLAFSLDKLGIYSEFGPEQLAFYTLLIMVPQEMAKLVDSNINLFHRTLFFSKKQVIPSRIKSIAVISIIILATYVVAFHQFSAIIFGALYQYPFSIIAFSTLLFFGQSLEYYVIHRTLAVGGANSILAYSLLNLCATLIAVCIGVMFDSLGGLIITMFIKQIVFSVVFSFFMRKFFNVI